MRRAKRRRLILRCLDASNVRRVRRAGFSPFIVKIARVYRDFYNKRAEARTTNSALSVEIAIHSGDFYNKRAEARTTNSALPVPIFAIVENWILLPHLTECFDSPKLHVKMNAAVGPLVGPPNVAVLNRVIVNVIHRNIEVPLTAYGSIMATMPILASQLIIF